MVNFEGRSRTTVSTPRLHNRTLRSAARISPLSTDCARADAAQKLIGRGVIAVMGQPCTFKPRRPSKNQRRRETAQRDAAARQKEARIASLRPAWQPHVLQLYPQRATT